MQEGKVLLLEDDPVLSKEVKDFLIGKGLDCMAVFDGELFLRQINTEKPSIYLMDINVPKINGLDLCKKIRQEDKMTPILMLTAFGEIEDKSDAFNSGADDYLVKPFHLEELYLRILSLLRRKEAPQNILEIIEIGDLKIDDVNKNVTRNEQIVALTPKEYKLLLILAKANGRVLSKQSIADELWDYHIETNHNTIEVYINFLRSKIDKNQSNKLIHTKVGYGYYLKFEE
jgi:DNA-binding response OmpR family regulator